jgi:hypothetical protein
MSYFSSFYKASNPTQQLYDMLEPVMILAAPRARHFVFESSPLLLAFEAYTWLYWAGKPPVDNILAIKQLILKTFRTDYAVYAVRSEENWNLQERRRKKISFKDS